MVIFIIIIFLIFFPIPFKVLFKVTSSKVGLFLFSKEITLRQKNKKPNKFHVSFFHLPKFFNLYNLYLTFKKSRIKITLKFITELEYGLDDAAFTAVSYGLINTFNPFLYEALVTLFNINDYYVSIKPNFDIKCFNLQITSIFYLSLAKTIYMLYKLKKNYLISEKHETTTSTNI